MAMQKSILAAPRSNSFVAAPKMTQHQSAGMPSLQALVVKPLCRNQLAHKNRQCTRARRTIRLKKHNSSLIASGVQVLNTF